MDSHATSDASSAPNGTASDMCGKRRREPGPTTPAQFPPEWLDTLPRNPHKRTAEPELRMAAASKRVCPDTVTRSAETVSFTPTVSGSPLARAGSSLNLQPPPASEWRLVPLRHP